LAVSQRNPHSRAHRNGQVPRHLPADRRDGVTRPGSGGTDRQSFPRLSPCSSRHYRITARSERRRPGPVCATVCALSFPAAASAQATGSGAQSTQLEEVVVTGFRSSLNTALAEKRAETSAIDVIAAEDIGKFPDGFLRRRVRANQSQILEKITSGYFMVSFDSGSDWSIPIRGDIGVRYVKTDQTAVGHIPVVAPAGAPYPTVGQRNQVDRSYNDTLPSLNVVFELTPDLLARFSASK
jgi:outer membrane receptor protein involved in Fe transport